MTASLPEWLIVCMWRSLLGEIYPSIRAIAVALSEDRSLLIRYYLDREPSEIDHESMEILATNISASMDLETIARIELSCQFTTVPFGILDCLDGFIYCRREYAVSE